MRFSGRDTAMRVQLGEHLLDTDSRELWHGEEAVHLTPKGFRLLEVLLEARPRAISKADLLQKVWPQTFISEASLSSLIAELRTALNDEAREPRFIRTVHGFGYAFCGEAKVLVSGSLKLSGQLCHRLIYAGREIVLTEGENLLGRGPEVAVWLEDPSVSRHHAMIVVADDGARLEDLGSKNGTWLRSERLQERRALADGDRILCGSVELTYRVFAAPASTVTRVL